MSQKVKILSARLGDTPVFLGFNDNTDPASGAVLCADAGRVLSWLCDGFRYEFNRVRAHRGKWRYLKDGEVAPQGVEVSVDGSGRSRYLSTLGDHPVSWSQPQLREAKPFMAALPSMLIHRIKSYERQQWFGAIERRKTLAAKGSKAGKMPGFLRRKDAGQSFSILSNYKPKRGTYDQARLVRTGKRTGQVLITGTNPAGTAGVKQTRWVLKIRVRLSEEIRQYSSVHVNIKTGFLTFVNTPTPITQRSEANETATGLDRGVVHLGASDDGRFFDVDWEELRRLDALVRKHQRALSRLHHQFLLAHPGKSLRQYKPSLRARRLQGWINKHKARATRMVTDAQHKAATDIVAGANTVVIESLPLSKMAKRPDAKPDPLRAGHFLPNGAGAKAGLNRVMAQTSLGRLAGFLQYRLDLTGGTLIQVPARYTSQRCHKCGFVAPENRENQADFVCKNTACNYAGNADHNAAQNILWIVQENNLKAITPPKRGTAKRKNKGLDDDPSDGKTPSHLP